MENSWEPVKRFWRRHSLPLTMALALAFGLVLASYLVPQPVIGTLDLKAEINSAFAEDFSEQVRFARENPEIKAVVVRVNSPGGEAAASEDLYLSLLELGKVKPVVVEVEQIAASGAYYASVAANYVVAKPSSDIGGVGVISSLPEPEEVGENKIITGPFKGQRTGKRHYARQVELIKESFLNAVVEQRQGRLKLPKEVIAEAQVYKGMEAVKYGLVDEIGSGIRALEKAAELAGIVHYRVRDVSEWMGKKKQGVQVVLFVDENQLSPKTNTVPANYFLYVEHEG